MRKYLLISSLLIIFCACGGNKGAGNIFDQKEDLNAKGLLQGIWIDDDSESPIMLIKGDSIYYTDRLSAPMTFKIIGDTLYTLGHDTAQYKIDKQGEYIFWFHSTSDNMVKLHRSEDANDSLSFVNQENIASIPVYTEVTMRDSVVFFNGDRYHEYVYINPSKMKVVKTVYTEEGLAMDNIYYDNVMHICVYEGKRSVYAMDITKQMFDKVIPNEFLTQAILSDIKYRKVDKDGFHYQAILAIPQSSIYSLANLTVGFKGNLSITQVK